MSQRTIIYSDMEGNIISLADFRAQLNGNLRGWPNRRSI